MSDSWEDLSDDLHELEEWEQEFHARFGGEHFLPYIDPSRVRQWVKQQITKAKEDLIEEIEEEWIKATDDRKFFDFLDSLKGERH